MLEFDLLKPNEVAGITGVSAYNQRNLRRASYLHRNEGGHARFTPLETAELLVIGQMSERGIGPKVATTFADTAARGIFMNLLWRPEIYSPEAAALAFEASRTDFEIGLPGAEIAVERELTEAERLQLHGGCARRWLAETLERQSGMSGEKAPAHFVHWPNGHSEFFYGEDHPFADVQFNHPAWQGPAIMFTLGGMAALFASRLPRPIVLLKKGKE
ncbi:MAG: hypothetical protein IOD05_07980 [Rhodobacter sp.]|nr:hypothetical protein [Rhodobacter sp.]MCA3493659.1 hypothetical protein [Rhodobacter sp.]MCA3500162.1 hypothetical protein [Rhodobacter sp.]MCA3503172.1 hypothetical protein [Rhodobacter sp.]MCA3517399.1 hypothetical protein [Rhodobacter sp.]